MGPLPNKRHKVAEKTNDRATMTIKRCKQKHLSLGGDDCIYSGDQFVPSKEEKNVQTIVSNYKNNKTSLDESDEVGGASLDLTTNTNSLRMPASGRKTHQSFNFGKPPYSATTKSSTSIVTNSSKNTLQSFHCDSFIDSISSLCRRYPSTGRKMKKLHSPQTQPASKSKPIQIESTKMPEDVNIKSILKVKDCTAVDSVIEVGDSLDETSACDISISEIVQGPPNTSVSISLACSGSSPPNPLSDFLANEITKSQKLSEIEEHVSSPPNPLSDFLASEILKSQQLSEIEEPLFLASEIIKSQKLSEIEEHSSSPPNPFSGFLASEIIKSQKLSEVEEHGSSPPNPFSGFLASEILKSQKMSEIKEHCSSPNPLSDFLTSEILKSQKLSEIEEYSSSPPNPLSDFLASEILKSQQLQLSEIEDSPLPLSCTHSDEIEIAYKRKQPAIQIQTSGSLSQPDVLQQLQCNQRKNDSDYSYALDLTDSDAVVNRSDSERSCHFGNGEFVDNNYDLLSHKINKTSTCLSLIKDKQIISSTVRTAKIDSELDLHVFKDEAANLVPVPTDFNGLRLPRRKIDMHCVSNNQKENSSRDLSKTDDYDYDENTIDSSGAPVQLQPRLTAARSNSDEQTFNRITLNDGLKVEDYNDKKSMQIQREEIVDVLDPSEREKDAVNVDKLGRSSKKINKTMIIHFADKSCDTDGLKEFILDNNYTDEPAGDNQPISIPVDNEKNSLLERTLSLASASKPSSVVSILTQSQVVSPKPSEQENASSNGVTQRDENEIRPSPSIDNENFSLTLVDSDKENFSKEMGTNIVNETKDDANSPMHSDEISDRDLSQLPISSSRNDPVNSRSIVSNDTSITVVDSDKDNFSKEMGTNTVNETKDDGNSPMPSNEISDRDLSQPPVDSSRNHPANSKSSIIEQKESTIPSEQLEINQNQEEDVPFEENDVTNLRVTNPPDEEGLPLPPWVDPVYQKRLSDSFPPQSLFNPSNQDDSNLTTQKADKSEIKENVTCSSIGTQQPKEMQSDCKFYPRDISSDLHAYMMNPQTQASVVDSRSCVHCCCPCGGSMLHQNQPAHAAGAQQMVYQVCPVFPLYMNNGVEMVCSVNNNPTCPTSNRIPFGVNVVAFPPSGFPTIAAPININHRAGLVAGQRGAEGYSHCRHVPPYSSHNNATCQVDSACMMEDRDEEDCSKNADSQRPSSSRGGGGGLTHRPFVICYICGREFGSASIGIHEKSCLQKWRSENGSLPPKHQRPEPVKPQPMGGGHGQTPTGSVSHSKNASVEKIPGSGKAEYNLDALNDAAYASAQAQKVKCQKCGRSFGPDRLPVHTKNCYGFHKIN